MGAVGSEKEKEERGEPAGGNGARNKRRRETARKPRETVEKSRERREKGKKTESGERERENGVSQKGEK